MNRMPSPELSQRAMGEASATQMCADINLSICCSSYSCWKPDGDLRICIDYCDLNKSHE